MMDYFKKVIFNQTLTHLLIEDLNYELPIYYEIRDDKLEISSVKNNDSKEIYWCTRIIFPEINKILGLRRLEIKVIKISNVNIKCNLDLNFFKNLKELILLKTKINGSVLFNFKKFNLISIRNKAVLNYQLSIFLKKKIKLFNIKDTKVDDNDIEEIKNRIGHKIKLVVD